MSKLACQLGTSTAQHGCGARLTHGWEAVHRAYCISACILVLNCVLTHNKHAQALGSGQARRPKQGGQPWVMKGKKRSEVDRRLDILVGASGKLKDGTNSNTVIGMLRLFNLCDVAPTITQDNAPRRERETRTTSPVRSLAPAEVSSP